MTLANLTTSGWVFLALAACGDTRTVTVNGQCDVEVTTDNGAPLARAVEVHVLHAQRTPLLLPYFVLVPVRAAAAERAP